MNNNILKDFDKNISLYNTRGLKDLKAQNAYNIIKDINTDIIDFALKDLKRYDKSTYNHSISVAILTALMAQNLDLKKCDAEELILSAMIHDIGKVKLPLSLINYNGKYNKEQKKIVMQHPEYGKEYFNCSKIPDSILSVILQHHECCNGTGYPYGLFHNDIHMYSKIVSICDIFEAYTAKRSYHYERSFAEGIEYLNLLKIKGKLDEKYTELFIGIIMKNIEERYKEINQIAK